MRREHPQDWRPTSLGSVAQYINGRAFKPSEWGKTGLPIIRIAQINNPDAECDRYSGPIVNDHRVDNGDLLFSWSATLTSLIWNRGPAAVNQHIFKVVPSASTDLHFLHHLLESLIDAFSAHAHGSTMQHIKRSDLLPFPVWFPPLPEQRRIAAILDTADEAIQKTQSLIDKLKQMKAGLLHDLLTRGLDQNGALRDPLRRPEEFKETRYGAVPTNWDISSIGDLFEIQLGKMLSKASKTGRYSFPYLANRNVQWDHVDVSDLEEMDFTPGEQSKFSLQNGDVLICEGGEVGRTAIWRGELRDCYYQKAIHRLRPTRDDAIPEFLLLFMHRAAAKGWLKDFTSQTSIAHLTREKLIQVPMLKPPCSEQRAIVSILESHDTRIRTEETYLDKIKQIKKGLMHDLLTGRVRVPVPQETTV